MDIYTGTDTTPETITVGRSSDTSDDHNNGALVVEPFRPPIVFYTQHSAENLVRYRVGKRNIEDGLGSFHVERTITTLGGTTYPQVFVIGSVIHLIFRDDLTHWSYTKSTDWGVSFSTPVRFVSHTVQSHATAVDIGGLLRFVIGAHPGNGDEVIRYVEINLTTGAITQSDGTVLGNLDGTNLPIAVASLESVTSPVTPHDYKWVYDVSDATDPEIVWVSWDGPDLPSTATYWYSKRVDGTWADPQDIALAGGKFSDPSQPYLGGCQMPRETPGGRVYVSRKVGSAWEVERYDTIDTGASWTITNLAISGSPLVRAWPVESRDASTPPIEVVGELIWRFTSYEDMASRVLPLEPNSWFD